MNFDDSGKKFALHWWVLASLTTLVMAPGVPAFAQVQSVPVAPGAGGTPILSGTGYPIVTGFPGSVWTHGAVDKDGQAAAKALAPAVRKVPAKLTEAVEAAIMTSPDVLLAFQNYMAVTRELSATRGRFLPGIDVTSSTGRERRNDPVPVTPNLSTKNFNRDQNSVALRQLIFDGGNTFNDVDRLDYARRGKIFELQTAANTSALEATRAYIDMLRHRTLVSLAEDNYVAHKVILEQLKLKATAGVGKKSDVEQAQSRFALAEYNLNAEGANLHDMEARFQRHTGQLPPTYLDAGLPFNTGIPGSAVDAVSKAHANNPSILSSVMDIKSQEKLVKVRTSSFLPRVEFRARHDFGTNLNGYIGLHRNDVVEVVANWNLLNGGSDYNMRRKELELVQAAEKKRDLSCRNARLELEIAYNDIRKLKEQMNYLDLRQIAIERARDAYRQQFEIGQRSLVDLLNSETEVFEAKRLYTNISNDLFLAYARAHHQLGSLLQVLNVQRYGALDAPLPEVGDDHMRDLAVDCPVEVPTPYKVNNTELDSRAVELLRPFKPMPAASNSGAGPDIKSRTKEAQLQDRKSGN